MKNPIFAASYERGVELMAAGCPLDYLDALPHQSFRAEQLPGYADSRVYELGPCDAGWVIPLVLRTDRPSGTFITGWSFELPWKGHDIHWGYEPEDIIPKKHQDDYKHLFDSRLTGVLNEGRLIRRGYPVEGLLCGRSYKPIGESVHGFISAKLSFTDDLGNLVPLCIDLNAHTHSYSSARHHVDSARRFRLRAFLAGLDSESGRRVTTLRLIRAMDQGGKPEEALPGVAQDA